MSSLCGESANSTTSRRSRSATAWAGSVADPASSAVTPLSSSIRPPLRRSSTPSVSATSSSPRSRTCSSATYSTLSITPSSSCGMPDPAYRAVRAGHERRGVSGVDQADPHPAALLAEHPAHQRQEPGPLPLVEDRRVEPLEGRRHREARPGSATGWCAGRGRSPPRPRRRCRRRRRPRSTRCRPRPGRCRRSRRRRRSPPPPPRRPRRRRGPGTSGSDGGSRLACSACPVASRAPWARALSMASAARRAIDSVTSSTSSRSGLPTGRPSTRCPIPRPRASSRSVVSSPASSRVLGVRRARRARSSSSALRRSSTLPLVRVPDLLEHRLAALVVEVDAHTRWPSRGIDDLAGDRHRHVLVQRVGEQVAGLGDERQPAATLALGGLQPRPVRGQRERVRQPLQQDALVVAEPVATAPRRPPARRSPAPRPTPAP